MAKKTETKTKTRTLPSHIVNNIDEVKLIKSKRSEILNAQDNQALKAEKERRKDKHTLMDIKADFQDELQLLSDIKARQHEEAQKFQQRRDAQHVLTAQINENNMRRIKEQEEKDKEVRHMRLAETRLLQDEARDRAVMAENKERLKSDLDAANQQMILHKEELVAQDKAEDAKVKKQLQDQAELNEKLKAEELASRKRKEEQQRKMLEKQEKATDFVSKLDELRMKRQQEELERKERVKELENEKKRQLQKDMLLEEGERQREYKMQLMLGNIEEERTHYERQLAEKKQEDIKLRSEQELQLQQRLTNKEFVVHQMADCKNRTKLQHDQRQTEEKRIIQDNVLDLNSKVIAIKGETLGDLGDRTKNCRKIIDRIGNKTSFF